MIAWKIPDRRDTSYLRLGQTLVSAALPVQGRARAGGPVNRVKRPLTEECKILERPSQLMHLAAQMSPTPRPIDDGQHHHCRSQSLSRSTISRSFCAPPTPGDAGRPGRLAPGCPYILHACPSCLTLGLSCQQWHTTPRRSVLTMSCSVLFCPVLSVCRSVCLPARGGVELSLSFQLADDVRRLPAVDGETPRRSELTH